MRQLVAHPSVDRADCLILDGGEKGWTVSQEEAAFTLLDEEPGVVSFAVHHNVNIFVWTGGATLATTNRIARIVAEQVVAEPRGLSTIHVMTMSATPPTTEARKAFAEIATRWQDTIVSVALVFEREGFWGSAMRSAITGVTMLMPKGSYPMKVHRSIHEVAAWMPEHHKARSGVTLSSAGLLRVLGAIRARALEHARSVAGEFSPPAQ